MSIKYNGGYIPAVGADGSTLVADSSTSTGLRYQAPYSQQPVLNSAFQVWQRGTSIALSGFAIYGADRWMIWDTANATGMTVSRQATNDTTNLPNIQYCARYQRNAGQTTTSIKWLYQSFESVNSIPFAGKTVTLSFYARAGANYSATSNGLNAVLGTGTGTDQNWNVTYTGQASPINQTATLTTTWQRFSYTTTLASTVTELSTAFGYSSTGTAGANDYFEITGVQLEVGSVATPFHTYAVTLQGELAACQRYYVRFGGAAAYENFASAFATSTTQALCLINLPVTQRVAASAIDFSTTALYEGIGFTAVTAYSINGASTNQVRVAATVASGLTQYRPYDLMANNSTSAYIAFSAEL